MTRTRARLALTIWSRFIAAGAAALVVGVAAPPLAASDDLLQRTRAAYAALRSYSDTGVVLKEYGTSSKDRHTFTTYYKAPRRFYFDFKKEAGDRYVIWSDDETFHTWWKTTGVEDKYPRGSGVGAFGSAEFQTVGSAMKIPTLLFSQAGLQGALTHFTDPILDGTEEIEGHRCHRLVGSTRDVYTATGREVNVRKLTVWIDTESLLIRKVLEVPKDTLPGQISRTTTTFEPQANPALDDGRFRFTPPAQN